MEEKCNSAIVGCGFIAQTHLRVLKKLNSVKVVAVCDTDEKLSIDSFSDRELARVLLLVVWLRS